MSLTGIERARIRFYLGYAANGVNVNPELIDLESAMDNMNMRADDLALLRLPGTGVLARLESVEAALLDARKRIKASKVGSIELNNMEICQLRSEQERARADLAAILGVENLRRFANQRKDNYVGI